MLTFERANVNLANRVTRLENRHDELRDEVALVTGPKGVLAGVIGQLRVLKGQDESLRREVVDVIRGENPAIDEGDYNSEAQLQGADLMQPTAMTAVARSGYTEVTPIPRPADASVGDGGKGDRVSENGE